MKSWGFILAILMSVSSVFGVVLTVPTPYATIQDAIDAASDTDTVVVSMDTYYENIDMGGKAITLTSTDPNDPDVVAQTIIDGSDSGSVILCDTSEDSDTVIAGFLIQNGSVSDYGGGIQCWRSSPTIKNCVFIANISDNLGGGIFCYQSNSMVTNCMFIGNTATQNGGGIDCYTASPTIMNCIFSGNDADFGGGLAFTNTSLPTVANCTFAGNTADTGGGMYCTSNSDPTVVNSIFWGNSAASGPEIYHAVGSDPAVSYSTITGCGGSGAEWVSSFGVDAGGNLDADPNFVDANGADDIVGTEDDDFHLDPYSVCINAGDPTGDYMGQTDMDYVSRVRYDSVDIGADEVFYVGADLSQDEADEQVGVEDLLLFADMWLTDVDFDDFVPFSKQWLYGAE